jgi:hypothetical protein
MLPGFGDPQTNSKEVPLKLYVAEPTGLVVVGISTQVWVVSAGPPGDCPYGSQPAPGSASPVLSTALPAKIVGICVLPKSDGVICSTTVTVTAFAPADEPITMATAAAAPSKEVDFMEPHNRYANQRFLIPPLLANRDVEATDTTLHT